MHGDEMDASHLSISLEAHGDVHPGCRGLRSCHRGRSGATYQGIGDAPSEGPFLSDLPLTPVTGQVGLKFLHPNHFLRPAEGDGLPVIPTDLIPVGGQYADRLVGDGRGRPLSGKPTTRQEKACGKREKSSKGRDSGSRENRDKRRTSASAGPPILGKGTRTPYGAGGTLAPFDGGVARAHAGGRRAEAHSERRRDWAQHVRPPSPAGAPDLMDLPFRSWTWVSPFPRGLPLALPTSNVTNIFVNDQVRGFSAGRGSHGGMPE